MRPRLPKSLAAAVLFMAACGEPTRSVPAPLTINHPGDAIPARFALLRPIIEDEAARLLVSFGSGDSEQPLRQALRILGDRAATDHYVDVGATVRDAGGLVISYRHANAAVVDPSDLDALELLIAAVDETRRPQ